MSCKKDTLARILLVVTVLSLQIHRYIITERNSVAQLKEDENPVAISLGCSGCLESVSSASKRPSALSCEGQYVSDGSNDRTSGCSDGNENAPDKSTQKQAQTSASQDAGHHHSCTTSHSSGVASGTSSGRDDDDGNDENNSRKPNVPRGQCECSPSPSDEGAGVSGKNDEDPEGLRNVNAQDFADPGEYEQENLKRSDDCPNNAVLMDPSLQRPTQQQAPPNVLWVSAHNVLSHIAMAKSRDGTEASLDTGQCTGELSNRPGRPHQQRNVESDPNGPGCSLGSDLEQQRERNAAGDRKVDVQTRLPVQTNNGNQHISTFWHPEGSYGRTIQFCRECIAPHLVERFLEGFCPNCNRFYCLDCTERHNCLRVFSNMTERPDRIIEHPPGSYGRRHWFCFSCDGSFLTCENCGRQFCHECMDRHVCYWRWFEDDE